MNKKQYKEKRAELMNAAQVLLDQGKAAEAEAKMDEVKELDDAWDAIAQAQANFNALNKEPQAMSPFGAAGEKMNFTNTIKEHEENMYDTEEYRKAFMNYVTRGIAIPEKFTNTNANTKTTDVGAVISPTVINQIIEKMETIGMIVPLVT